MMNDWKPLEELEITPQINTIHCDTRDFHCICHTEPIDLRDGRERQITSCLHTLYYFIDDFKIKSFLQGLKDISGGDSEWRMLSFKNINDMGWLKYIRFYRHPKHPNKFIVCNSSKYPIKWECCTEENLIKDYLCAH